MKNIISISGLILSIILIQSCKKETDDVIKDIDGNVYNSVTIGTQVWMTENLKVTRYRNGDLIRTTTPATLDVTAEIAPKYQWAYDGNESKVETYGRLYTWYAVSDSRNLCPTGWHVPAFDEWKTLRDFLGGENIAGGKLKESGTSHWASPNEGASNETGFTARPGGEKYIERFEGMGVVSRMWSSTVESNTSKPYFLQMDFGYSYLYWDFEDKISISVRCLKDN
jgi:uncharacterized protein (TIGR02145 family)